MRTSIDLPDELLREAKIAAVNRGVTLRELMTRALKKELLGAAADEGSLRRLSFPLIRSTGHGPLRITEDAVRQSELNDDLRRSGLAP